MGDTGIILWGNDRWLGFSSLAFHILSTEQWLEDVNARENACNARDNIRDRSSAKCHRSSGT